MADVIDQRPYLELERDECIITPQELEDRREPLIRALLEAGGQPGGLYNKPRGVLSMIDREYDRLYTRFYIGGTEEALERYDSMAERKSAKVGDTGLGTAELREAPYLADASHVIWRGGLLDGRWIIVFSGVQEVFDEAITQSARAHFKALSQERDQQLMRAYRDLLPGTCDPDPYSIAAELLRVMNRENILLITDALEFLTDEAAIRRVKQINARSTATA